MTWPLERRGLPRDIDMDSLVKHELRMRLLNVGTLLQVTQMDLIDFDQVIHELRAIEAEWLRIEQG